ncbi:hypothetical protein PT7_0561 [Pusillimonas sp. T7-7]|uniref:DUF3348 domain-containing protein n=1 Tax=Pusillimonas sp. (strain T7-7) TaxID=1007105 RepID=UPI0002085516|nr:DUF3348 domain-containing protein [Pusillimonas sp. T7-7]AEC19101.1 hypothetical protein PT7_0561 [Pusillimonas sp. T7-7]
MAQELPRRTGFSGPALIRLLVSLNDADILEPAQSISDRLSQWLGWSEAIALASALGAAAPAVFSKASRLDEEREYNRVRKVLGDAIAGINTPAPARHRARQSSAVHDKAVAVDTVEFSTYRQRYVSLQQNMETRCTELRGRLRTTLATMSPDMARLAAVDAVMEQALNEREFCVLARVPVLLETRFKRLKQVALEPPADESAAGLSPANRANSWLDVFHQDMQSVLFAELDIRLQPAQGLLAALGPVNTDQGDRVGA